MESTDYLILGFCDGVCVASAWKQQGKGAAAFNAETVRGWARKGLDIQTVHKSDPVAKAAHDQMWENARLALVASQAHGHPRP